MRGIITVLKRRPPLLHPVQRRGRHAGSPQQTAPTVNRLLLACLLWLAAPVLAGELEGYPEVGPTPPLTLQDLSGSAHSLDDYRGQVVLVNFWATWCPPCLIEMPSMQRLNAGYPDTAFTVLAVNVKESRGKVWRFQKLVDVNFTFLLDKTGQTAEDWNVAMYPTSYLVDKAGRIRYVAYGTPDWDSGEIRQVIDALVNESPQQSSKAIRTGGGIPADDGINPAGAAPSPRLFSVSSDYSV